MGGVLVDRPVHFDTEQEVWTVIRDIVKEAIVKDGALRSFIILCVNIALYTVKMRA